MIGKNLGIFDSSLNKAFFKQFLKKFGKKNEKKNVKKFKLVSKLFAELFGISNLCLPTGAKKLHKLLSFEYNYVFTALSELR